MANTPEQYTKAHSNAKATTGAACFNTPTVSRDKHAHIASQQCRNGPAKIARYSRRQPWHCCPCCVDLQRLRDAIVIRTVLRYFPC